MAHLGVFTLKKADGYQKLEDVIKQQITDFSFENEKNTLYLFRKIVFFAQKNKNQKNKRVFPVLPMPLLNTYILKVLRYGLNH